MKVSRLSAPVCGPHMVCHAYCQIAAASLNLSDSTRRCYFLAVVCLASAAPLLRSNQPYSTAAPSRERSIRDEGHWVELFEECH